MNEVKKIHIARQSFTIAVDAHGDLKNYLDALTRRLKDSEVIEEIEMRIVELLAEQKVTGEKVILKKDVAYIRKNLGEPADFEEAEQEGDQEAEEPESNKPRRFMRDTRGQVLGGVANGLATYFGVDPLWFRLAFIVLTFASGFGILLYLVLWVIMPEAKTSSDYLQMQGKPVTVESLTAFAESAEFNIDVKRVESVARDIANIFARIILLAVGAGLTTLGMIGILSSIAGSVYIIAASDSFFNGIQIFPVGATDVAVVILSGVVGVCASLLLLFSGMGIFAKRWQLPNWATAGLISVFFVSLFVALPLGLSSVPKLEKRIEAARYSQSRTVPEFKKIAVANDDVDVTYEQAESYSVEVKTFGTKDISTIKTDVIDGVLKIDTAPFTNKYGCSHMCMYDENVRLIVRAPSLEQVQLNGQVDFFINQQLNQSTIKIEQDFESTVDLQYMFAGSVSYEQGSAGRSVITIENIKQDATEDDFLRKSSYGPAVTVQRAGTVSIVGSKQTCSQYEPLFELYEFPNSITVGGQVLQTREQLDKLQLDEVASSNANCVRIQ